MKSILLQQVQFEDVGEKSERLSGHCNQLLKTGKKKTLGFYHILEIRCSQFWYVITWNIHCIGSATLLFLFNRKGPAEALFS